jgi:hypothetical protein
MRISQGGSVGTITLAAAILLATAGAARGQVIYDSTVGPLPGNLPSVGAEAYAFNQLGDAVTFAGTSRKLVSVAVTLSSWGCQSGSWHTGDCVTTPGATFTVPITFNIYNAGNPSPGALITTRTQTFSVPYRPSADNINCIGGRWYDVAEATCFNGLATNVTFTFALPVLPNSAVYGIVYNTTHYGPSPIGELAPCFTSSGGCPYDSMNIALAPVVTAGLKPYPDTLYQNSPYGGQYCDGGLDGMGAFRLDSPTSACWVDLTQSYIPAARFIAANPPLTKDDCKKGTWQSLTNALGQPFPNQGQCIQYVNTGK